MLDLFVAGFCSVATYILHTGPSVHSSKLAFYDIFSILLYPEERIILAWSQNCILVLSLAIIASPLKGAYES